MDSKKLESYKGVNSGYHLLMVRVSKEFTLDGVLYPLGAIRLWSTMELSDFCIRMQAAGIINSTGHFEYVERQ